MKKVMQLFRKEIPFIFMCPALLWQILFLYVPMVALLVGSLFEYNVATHSYSFTLRHYAAVFQPFYLKILGNSLRLALETTLITLFIAYPVAYFLAFKVTKFRLLYLLLMILPSWTSLILQIYAWFFLLKQDGFISQILYKFGFITHPIHMLNNHGAMLVGMVYCYLPFMVLPIYAVLEKIDGRLLEASADLGASRWVTIRKIIFPLSLSGVVAGVFLVFLPAFGEFAIPEFLGGSKQLFWGNVIVAKFLDYCDWSAGAAVTYSGILFPVFLILLFYVINRVIKLVTSRSRLIKTMRSGWTKDSGLYG